MFTGIIKEIGKITKIKNSSDKAVFTVETTNILKDKKLGDSIAINGVCITVTSINNNLFTFDASKETMDATTFKELQEGDIINMESTLKLSDGLDGHMVQGHVDAIGTVHSITNSKENTVLEIKFPPEISKYLAFKGSITVNGISLTIADLRAETFSVAIIPYTLEHTNLKNLQKGDKVNLETDMIARYLERLVQNKEKESKYGFLKERGFI